MVTSDTWHVGAGLLLLAVFVGAAAVLVAGIYTVLPVGLPLFVLAVFVAPAALYGFYRTMATLVESNRATVG